MIDGNLRGSRKSKEGKARALPFEPAKGREAPGPRHFWFGGWRRAGETLTRRGGSRGPSAPGGVEGQSPRLLLPYCSLSPAAYSTDESGPRRRVRNKKIRALTKIWNVTKGIAIMRLAVSALSQLGISC